MANRVIDSLIVFRILKMLTTPFNKMKAYKFGFIDERGNRIKELPDPNDSKKRIPNNPVTTDEKNSLTPLHRLVFNLKKIIEKVPFGKSAFASYAVALLLLKEEMKLPADQTDELFEKFYTHLKKEGKLDPEQLTEAVLVGKVNNQDTHSLRTQIKQNFDENGEIKVYPPKSIVENVSKKSIGFGITIYEGYIGHDKIIFTAEDVY